MAVAVFSVAAGIWHDPDPVGFDLGWVHGGGRGQRCGGAQA